MAVRKIFKLGQDDKILRSKCKKVEAFDERLGKLLDDLKETLADIGGLGLAAPQIGVLRRAVVIEYREKIIELVNPEFTFLGKETCVDNEGCLSVVGYRGLVRRPCEMTVKFFDRHGKPQEISASGYDARVFMHEIDHLDGILFVDKMIKKLKD